MAVLALLSWRGAAAFEFAEVIARADQLAHQAYAAPPAIPALLHDLSYDQFRKIRFDPERSLWREAKSRFQVMPVAPGRTFDHAVKINVVEGGRSRPLAFQKDWFDFGDPELAQRVPPDLGYAGFKLSYPINRPDVQDQFLVFAGASYFRGVGKGDQFGLSARGVALDTGLASGEEFPSFVEYWLLRPAATDKQMIFYALLDSRRLTGAYRFVVQPGQPTRLAVQAVLFTRGEVGLLGVAPLTSMFYYGENSARPAGEWRLEVHDSDGLLVHNGGGEWLWHPLLNPVNLEMQSFLVENPRGFGLLQRDRRYESYQDAETRYDLRPGGWVLPRGDWGTGRIMLLEIPTPDETNDNIVAFWAPPAGVGGGQRLSFDYDLLLGDPGVVAEPMGFVQNTFVGDGGRIGSGNNKDAYRLVVDFTGGLLGPLPEDAPVQGMVTALGGGEILSQYVQYIAAARVWRLSLLVRPAKDAPLSLRAFLARGEETLTETWTYTLPAKNDIRPRKE